MFVLEIYDKGGYLSQLLRIFATVWRIAQKHGLGICKELFGRAKCCQPARAPVS